MSDVVRLRTQAEVDEAAALWVWRLDAGPLDDALAAEFDTWLQQDSRHKRALDELARAWGLLYTPKHRLRPPAPASAPAARARHGTAFRFPGWWAAAASLLVAAIAAAWLHGRTESRVLETLVGQHRSVKLVDSSVVTLNTDSVVQIELGQRTRVVYLRKGEAHFEVAHERWRPFIVHAGQTAIRAVGTQFDVRLNADRSVDVLVNEGRVAIAQNAVGSFNNARATGVNATAASPRLLSAGEELSARGHDYTVREVVPQQLSDQLAWREGAIVFNGETLAQAVSEVARYTHTRIVISDPRVSGLPIGGRFRTNDLPGFFDALQAALPVTVRSADGLVYIEYRR